LRKAELTLEIVSLTRPIVRLQARSVGRAMFMQMSAARC
jgi:hypothetical protein